MKKIAMLKLGSRIADTGTAASGGQALGLAKILSKHVKVDCFTKVLKSQKTSLRSDGFYKVLKNSNTKCSDSSVDILDIQKGYNSVNGCHYDALVVISGNVNFFGGAQDRQQILNYHIINNFDGPIFYILVDVNLFLKQIWDNVSKKPWGDRYSQKDILIERDDIVYISQPYALQDVKKKIYKTGINVKDVRHFPIQKWILTQDRLPLNMNRSVDLIYGGAYRPSRQNKLIKYYFGHNPQQISVQLFGNFKLNKFKQKKIQRLEAPEFSKPVKFTQFMNKMQTSYSTIIIGDKWYQGRNITLRVYESILSSVLTFIDYQFDPQMRVYKDKNLRDILYVKNRQQFVDKYKLIRDNNAFESFINLQYIDTKIDVKQYSKDLINLMEEYV